MLGAALLSWLALATRAAGGLAPELEEVLAGAPAGARIDVVVSLRTQASVEPIAHLDRRARREALLRALQNHAEQTQAPLRSLLLRRHAARIESLWIANALAVSASPAAIRELAEQPEVESIRLDAAYVLSPTATLAAPPSEWNLDEIGAPALWSQGVSGQGVVAASMDTGADLAHPDLGPRWRGGANSWFDPHGQYMLPADTNGHGTGTLGILIGGSSSGAAIGVAPDALWIAVKIFDDAGATTASRIHLGFQWLLDPDGDPGTDDAPDVVNGSWYDAQSVGQCDDEFALDLAVLRGADIPVVLAAGNEGPGSGTSVSPANLPGALAVGASDELQQVPDFSSRGPSACDAGLYPRLVAPGVELRTADLTLGGLFPASYATVSGTSFAAPHVAGALVLLAGAFPGTDVAHLEEALEATARDLGAAGPDEDSGHGLVDVAAAHAFLASSPACDDGRDDDGDGLTDFPADPGCRYLESEAEDPQCNDGLDNDADGLVDFGSDPQCFAAWRASEAPVLSCGIGPEILALLPWLRRWRGRRC